MSNTCCSHNAAEQEKISRLIQFYTQYSKIWEEYPSASPEKLYYSLDSLQKQFCSDRARKEAKEWFFEGHDYFTNDWGIQTESLNSFDIEINQDDKSKFIVTYQAVYFPVSPFEKEFRQVILSIRLIEIDGKYLIDEVN